MTVRNAQFIYAVVKGSFEGGGEGGQETPSTECSIILAK